MTSQGADEAEGTACRTKMQALVPFGAGAAAAAAVCVLVASLPNPRREAVLSGTGAASPTISATPPASDVSVTVSGRVLHIHNHGPQGTGPVTLDVRGGKLRPSCLPDGCAWPDLPSGETFEVRLKGGGSGRAEVRTTVHDPVPGDNEVRLLLPDRDSGRGSDGRITRGSREKDGAGRAAHRHPPG